MKKVIGIILTVFGSFGIFFALIFALVFGGIGFGFNSAKKNIDDIDMNVYSTCVGTITSSQGTGNVSSGTGSSTVISYSVDGNQYAGSVNYYNSNYLKGDSVTVYYRNDNPIHIIVPELTDSVMGTMGTIFSGVGIVFLVIFGVIGIAMIIGGVVLIRSAKKEITN